MFEFFNIVVTDIIRTFLGELPRDERVLLVSLVTYVIPATVSVFFLSLAVGIVIGMVSLVATIVILESLEREFGDLDSQK